MLFVTARELTGLPGLPATPKGIREALTRAAAGSAALMRRRTGSRALEFHTDCLPAAVREAVLQRHHMQMQQNTPAPEAGSAREETKPGLTEASPAGLTDRQRRVAGARMVLAAELFRMMTTEGLSRREAVSQLSSASRAGGLSSHLLLAAHQACARQSPGHAGVGVRALQHWLTLWLDTSSPGERLMRLAPAQARAKPAADYPWLVDFLRCYRQPQRPSVSMAYEHFAQTCRERYAVDNVCALPSLSTVRHVLRKIPRAERQRGRMTGAAYRSLLPFVRRDWSVVPVNGVWCGDGHGMKLEVIHPETGRPFHPELTLITDCRTRMVMGWSLALSENQVAVADALRHAISRHGIPLIYYSDNGGGEKNRALDADITGLFARLGVAHHTGIPGNPQGRGIIERLHQEIPKRAAMVFGAWSGRAGDRDTQRRQQRNATAALRAQEKGRPLSDAQRTALRAVPSWAELTTEIERQVERHNRRPHRSLPRQESGEHWSPEAWRRYLLEKERPTLRRLSEGELHDLFRPEVIRTATRGEIQLFNNRYFSRGLMQADGQKVRVGFDIHDPDTVIVRRMDGSWLCDAAWNGNRTDAFPRAYMATLTEQSVARSVQRLEAKIRHQKSRLRPAVIPADVIRMMAANSGGERS